MADREKVICALENCAVKPKCKDCPWDTCELIDHATVTIPLDLATGILELLKAQEPRVLTLEEVMDALDTMVWVDKQEEENTSESFALIEGYSYKNSYVRLRFISGTRCEVSNLYYGYSWRCWSSRPTDEQREAVKWDG